MKLMKLTEAKQSSFTKCKPVNEVLRVLKKLHIQLTKQKKQIEILYF